MRNKLINSLLTIGSLVSLVGLIAIGYSFIFPTASYISNGKTIIYSQLIISPSLTGLICAYIGLVSWVIAILASIKVQISSLHSFILSSSLFVLFFSSTAVRNWYQSSESFLLLFATFFLIILVICLKGAWCHARNKNSQQAD